MYIFKASHLLLGKNCLKLEICTKILKKEVRKKNYKGSKIDNHILFSFQMLCLSLQWFHYL